MLGQKFCPFSVVKNLLALNAVQTLHAHTTVEIDGHLGGNDSSVRTLGSTDKHDSRCSAQLRDALNSRHDFFLASCHKVAQLVDDDNDSRLVVLLETALCHVFVSVVHREDDVIEQLERICFLRHISDGVRKVLELHQGNPLGVYEAEGNLRRIFRGDC